MNKQSVSQTHKQSWPQQLIALLLTCAIIPILNGSLWADPGDLDPTFGDNGAVTTDFATSDDYGRAVTIDANGKILVAGYTSGINGNEDLLLLRYNANGTLDTAFGANGMVTTSIGAGRERALAVAVDANGKILVGGYTNNGTNNDIALLRYSSDGSLDTTFDGDGKVTTAIGSGDEQGQAVALDGNGKILVAGYTNNGTNTDIALLRYNADGSLDTSFDGDGKVTTSVGTGDDYGQAMTLDANGKILVGGYTNNGANDDFALLRYNSNGSLDNTFDTDGKVTTDFANSTDQGHAMVIDANGKILIAGNSASVDFNSTDFALARYNSDGTLDTTFDSDGKVTSDFGSEANFGNSLALDANGKILVGGHSNINTFYDFTLMRYNSDGSLDTTFGTGGKVNSDFAVDDAGWAMALAANGKILVTGSSSFDIALLRYNGDGTLDVTFDGDGLVRTDIATSMDLVHAMVLDKNGKILVVGQSNRYTNIDMALARYNADGSLDRAFISNGMQTADFADDEDYAYAVALDANDRILVAGRSWTGTSWDIALARYRSDGQPELFSFGTGGKVLIDINNNEDNGQAVAATAEGKILVAGYSNTGTNYDFVLVRYNSDGSLDTTFDTDGKVTTDFATSFDIGRAMLIDGNGKILVAGKSDSNGNDDFALVRYNSDGSLDTTFDTDGKVTTDFAANADEAYALALDANGKILVTGGSVTGTNVDIALARYNSDGSLDTTFGTDGKVTTPVGTGVDRGYGVAVDADGKILVASDSFGDPHATIALVRYNTDGSLDTTFGTDGKMTTDIGRGDDRARALAIGPDGAILVAGFRNNGVDTDFTVVRYLGESTELTCPASGRRYVRVGGAGNRNGTSWNHAFAQLQDALLVPDVCAIWVAKGIYYPDEGTGQSDNSRTATFQLKNDVAIYGGFAGTESNLNERNWQGNITILSGDLDQNDPDRDGNGVNTNPTTSTGANAYHVITGSGTNNSARIDGFTITSGKADGAEGQHDFGGGMVNLAGSPTLANLTFRGNAATDGGGLYNFDNSNASLTNVTFQQNAVTRLGGGMVNIKSSPVLTGVTFTDNRADFGGGGLSNDGNSNPTLTNVIFRSNTAGIRGGGLFNTASNPTVVNGTFHANLSEIFGGGIANFASSNPTLINITVHANRATNSGGGIFTWDGNSQLTNTILWGNVDSGGTDGSAQLHNHDEQSTAQIRYSLIQGSGGSGTGWVTTLGTDGGSNIDADPRFIQPGNAASNPPTAGDLHLQNVSPAINTGLNGALPNGVTTDLDGKARIQHNTVDLGAYESTSPPATPTATVQPTPTAPATSTPTVQPTPTAPPTPTPTLPPADTSVDAQPNNEAAIVYNDPSGGGTEVTIPAGAVDEETTFLYDELDAPTESSNAFQFAGRAFTLTPYRNNNAIADFAFQQPATIELTYTDADIQGIDEATLTLTFYDTASKSWSSTGITIVERDTANNRLVVQIEHLTQFALAVLKEVMHEIYLPLLHK